MKFFIKVACMTSSTADLKLRLASGRSNAIEKVARNVTDRLESHRLSRASAFRLCNEVGTPFNMPIVQPTHFGNTKPAASQLNLLTHGFSTQEQNSTLAQSGVSGMLRRVRTPIQRILTRRTISFRQSSSAIRSYLP